MNEVIYYRFKKGFLSWLWLLFDIVALAFLFKCLWCFSPFIYMWQLLVLFVVIGMHLGFWFYKYTADNEMAVINDKDIKIDHSNPIAWNDIAYAEEKTVKCCGKNRKILSLVPREGINYKYSWLQLHNAGFTAFSIPLYGIISKEDEKKIIKIVEEKVGIKSAKTRKKEATKPALKAKNTKKFNNRKSPKKPDSSKQSKR